eukprot:TRINITY_DN96082_c0_g1_i1.p1 TRINITY_DN96082_c0_g1~~TRINITY_DN96082_c0_g1_i1.p1  ORF type:complete len:336 (-),score=68.51 TRINITY_DN96082_c0_g1_i1:128-1060(-)
MPALGLGTWQSAPGEVGKIVGEAIDAGYRHIDCAHAYGNEKEIGDALKAKFDAGFNRDDLFIVSKLWNTDHEPERVKQALQTTLDNLQLKCLDLYLVHWPHGFQGGDNKFPKDDAGNILYSQVDYLDTWKVLEECVKEGKAKAIGVSNFSSKQVQRVLDACTIKPAVNQIECHPYFKQAKLIEYCKSVGVVVTAYSPLGAPARPWVSDKEPIVLNDPTVAKIAEKNKKSPAQVAIRYQLQRGITVIPKSSKSERLVENFAVLNFELSDEDMAALNGIEHEIRYMVPMVERDGKRVPRDAAHPHYPFNDEF